LFVSKKLVNIIYNKDAYIISYTQDEGHTII